MLRNYYLSKAVLLICFAALFIIFVFWLVNRPSGLNVTIFLTQIIPLAVFLPGIIQNHYRTYSWICFLLLFYFIKGVEGVFISTNSLSDGVFLAFISMAFVTSMMASRWAQRLHKNGEL